MNQNNFIRNNFGKITLIEINLNFFHSPEGPKSKLPIKRVLALVVAALTGLSNGVQAPVNARPTVEICEPCSWVYLYGWINCTDCGSCNRSECN